MKAFGPAGAPGGARAPLLFRRVALGSLMVLLALLLAPPLWWMSRDLWLLAWSGAPARQEARWVIQRDIARGSSRALEAANLLADPLPAGSAARPAIQPAMPRPDPLRRIATCDDRIYRMSGRDPTAGTDRSHFDARRRLYLDDARFRLAGERIGTPRLVMLNACVNATPFAGMCARAVLAEEDRLTFKQVVEELARRKALRVEGGRYCWVLPEFRVAATAL